VTDIACDIHRGALDEVRAATAIDDYLLTLHEGLARHLGERFPACCRTSSAAVTEAPTSPEDRVTRRFLAKSGLQRRAGVTVIPAEDLLQGLVTRADR
jgi:hypothetical protein